MGELIISISAVVTAFVLHLLLWRIRLPKRQTRTILLIFFGMLAFTVVSLPTVAKMMPALGLATPLPLASYLHVTVFITAVTLAYMITYTVIEVDSPSLVMALAIHRAGASGLPQDEFDRQMNDALLVEPRIRDMLRDGLAVQHEGRYLLTAKGRRMAGLFILHRRILGAGMGG